MNTGFWLSVTGAVMGMIAFYNEVPIKRKYVAVGLSFVVGILLLLEAPISFVFSIVAGLKWILADVLLWRERWRKIIVCLNVSVAIGLLVWFGAMILRNPSSIAPTNWRDAAQVIYQHEASSVSLRCVGCEKTDILLSLRFFLRERGVVVRDDAPVVYVIVPPLSSYQSRIPDTYAYQFGSLSVAISHIQP